jgi:hypothetical protein
MNEESRLSRRRAFLIHFGAGTSITGNQLLGRVEHVASGRAEHFTNTEQLWAFVSRILGDLECMSDGEILPESNPRRGGTGQL